MCGGGGGGGKGGRGGWWCLIPRFKIGFSLSRMTINSLTSPMKFCFNMSFTLPEQSQRSRFILEDDGSRCWGLVWKEKNVFLVTEEIW